MIDKIKSFAVGLAATDLFTVSCNVHADLDKDGNQEHTSIDFCFSYPRPIGADDEFVDAVDDEVDTGEEDFEDCVGDDAEMIEKIVKGALEDAIDIATSRPDNAPEPECTIHKFSGPGMEGFVAEMSVADTKDAPEKKPCCCCNKAKPTAQTGVTKEAIDRAVKSMMNNIMNRCDEDAGLNAMFRKFNKGK